MRILIASAYYWPEFSGTAPYVTAPAEYLAAQGHDVHVVAAYPHYPQWRELERRTLASTEMRNGVQIHRRWHTIPSAQSSKSRALYEASMLGFGSSALVSVPRPDVIFGVTPALASASLAYLAAQRFRRPYGLVIHDLMGRGAIQSGIGSDRVGRVIERVERRLAESASRLRVLADGMKDFFVDGGVRPDAISVVPTWTLRASPAVDRVAVRRSAGWSDSDFICFHGGNIGQKQGLENVVDAADLLRRGGSESVRIVLVGDGNDRSRLEAKSRQLGLQNLEFIPMQPAERYDELVAAADLLLLNQRPTVADMSLPSKLSAYLASGRPVLAAVSSDSPAAIELRRSEGGLIVDPGRPEGLVEGIEGLLGEPGLLDEIGSKGKEYAKRSLSSDAILPRYEEFVTSIAVSRSR